MCVRPELKGSFTEVLIYFVQSLVESILAHNVGLSLCWSIYLIPPIFYCVRVGCVF